MIIWSLIFVLWNARGSSCCIFPVKGTWDTSDHGLVTFSDTVVNGFRSIFFGTSDYTCVTNIDERYMARSSKFILHGVEFEVYLCLRLIYVTANKYKYYLATDENQNASNERLKSAASNAPLTFSEVCDRTLFETGSYSMMLRSGTVLSEMVECPTDIIAKWNYVVTDSSGNSYCTVNSSLDICQNTTLIFNTSQCSGNILHSVDGSFHCIYTTQVTTSSYYITTYNADTVTPNENTTFRFSCLLVEANTKDNISLYQYPQHCHPFQNAKNLSPENLLSLSYQRSCATDIIILNTTITPTLTTQKPTTFDANQAYIAVAIVIPILIVIIIAVIVGYLLWTMYQRKLKAKPLPDPKFLHGEIRNRRLNVQFEGMSPTYTDRANVLTRISEDSLSSAMIQSDLLESSSAGPSSLSSLLVSVPTPHTKDDVYVIKECVNDSQHNNDLAPSMSTPENDDTSMDISFHSIGVDTRDLKSSQNKRETRRTYRRRFRLGRSRSSVGDSLLSFRKDKSTSKSVVTFGTKNVVLGIQPPPMKKKRNKNSTIDRPAQPMDVLGKNEVKDKMKKTRKHKSSKERQILQTPDTVKSTVFEEDKIITEEERNPIIFFTQYQEEG